MNRTATGLRIAALAAVAVVGSAFGAGTASAQGGPVSLNVELGGVAADLGHVESDVPGIDCRPDCEEDYPDGTAVTLIADPQDDASFEGWAGGGCSGTGACEITLVDDGSGEPPGGDRRARRVAAPVTVTAEFSAPDRRITVTRAGTGSGTVSSNPAGIDCGSVCSATFAHHVENTVNLTPQPDSGSVFAGWSGAGCVGLGDCELPRTSDANVTATFEPFEPGNEIAFLSSAPNPSGGVFLPSEIFTMRPDGTNLLRLTFDSNFDAEPVIAPDGSRILAAGQFCGFFTMDPDGTNRTDLPPVQGSGESCFAGDPEYSPDGARIAFVGVGATITGDGGGGGAHQIFTMNADGTGQTRVTPNSAPVSDFVGHHSSPAFSADGERIAYVNAGEGGTNSKAGIHVINADGSGGDVQLTQNRTTGLDTSVDSVPEFSPDGTRIFFVRDVDIVGGPPPAIYSMNVDGSGVTPLTDGSGSHFHPQVSPDGARIAFTRSVDGQRDIYSMKQDGSDMVRLTNTPDFEQDLDWGPAPCDADGPSERSAERAGPAPEVGEFRRSMARKDARVKAVGDGDGGPPRIAEVVPDRAVTGASILLRGRNLASDRLRARVGSKPAKIVQAHDRSMLVKVPKIARGKHRVQLRRGERRAGARLRVLRPFDGTPGAELDTANATNATIGPSGGELTARGRDGTGYALEIPAGALNLDTEISLTPVKRFTGLPFSGDDVAGADLGPDGLILKIPATLRITGGGDFDGSTVGFGSSSGGFEATEPAGFGKEVVLTVDHFSSHGASEAEAADIANAFKPIVERQGNLSRSAIREVIRLLQIFDARFSARPNGRPPDFCGSQPVCQQAIAKAERSLEGHINETCRLAAADPTLFFFRELLSLQGELDLMGGNQTFSVRCRDGVANQMADQVLAALADDPLARFRDFELLDDGGDIDRDGSTSAFEMAHALAAEFDSIGVVDVGGATIDLSQRLRQARDDSFDLILVNSSARCEANNARAVSELRRGLAYAREVGQRESDFIDALRFCGVDVVVVPARAELGTDEDQRFEAVVTNPEVDAGGVRWSANGGEIVSEGLFAKYTAPPNEGNFTVRATSTDNPSRSSTATVVVRDEFCGPIRRP